jgi:hypothetical protein
LCEIVSDELALAELLVIVIVWYALRGACDEQGTSDNGRWIFRKVYLDVRPRRQNFILTKGEAVI